MGGTNFEHYAPGKDLNEAFRTARAEAAHEHGHGGYTGTVAEKDDVVVISRTPVSLEEAYTLAEELMSKDDPRINDKWGPAGAIAVVTGRRTAQLTVASGNLKDWSWFGSKGEQPSPRVLEAIKAKRLLKRGEKILSVSLRSYRTPTASYRPSERFVDGTAVIEIQDAYAATQRKERVSFVFPGAVTWDNQEEWKNAARSKVKLAADEKIVGYTIHTTSPEFRSTVESNSKQQAVTRYIIKGTKYGNWETGLPTIAAARKTLEGIVDDLTPHGPNKFEVEGVIRRVGNTPLLVGTRNAKRTIAVIEVTILKTPPRPQPVEPDGWLLFGWASC